MVELDITMFQISILPFQPFYSMRGMGRIYLLDILQNNKSDIQPDTIHGDTQSQNGPIFGLSYLLGINLMPRIRNWKDLTLYRPDETRKYRHIDELFTDTIDWKLIETYFPDMLRVALSIKEGKITPSNKYSKIRNV